MKLYLAGPMRGYVKHNFPAFDSAAAELRAAGHEVFNPADHDREIGFSEDTVDVPPETLSAMMRWDLARVMEVDAVVFLPGWEKSRGACAERTVAHYLGLPCYDIVYQDQPVPALVLVPQPEFEEPTIIWKPKREAVRARTADELALMLSIFGRDSSGMMFVLKRNKETVRRLLGL